MGILGGLIGAVIGGVIGAAIWAGIAYGASAEIGWIAWGVGGLVGLGSVLGNRKGGVPSGVLAAAVALLSVVAGKYVTIELHMRSEIGTEAEFLQAELDKLQNDELVVSYIADEIVEDWESGGQTVEWPVGVDPSGASAESDYPPDIWAEAAGRWEGMSTEEREAYRDDLMERTTRDVPLLYAYVAKQAFRATFGVLDLVFFGLAIVTAFKLAAAARVRSAEPGPPEGPDTSGQPEPS